MGYDFNQVLGGVLSAVAEARSMADRVSKDLALEYESDELLRAFPVPRMEFEQVDVDFKFALQASEEAPSADMEAIKQRAESWVTQTALRVRTTMVEHLGRFERDGFLHTPEYFDYNGFGYFVEFRVREIILDPTLAAALTPPKPGVTFETFSLEEVVNSVMEWLQERVEMDPEKVKDLYYELLHPVKEDHELGVIRIQELLLYLPTPGKFPMRILMQHNELAGLPTQSISSLKLTVHVRNYEWAKVDEVDGVAVRKLVRE